jgi:hypothetical protein
MVLLFHDFYGGGGAIAISHNSLPPALPFYSVLTLYQQIFTEKEWQKERRKHAILQMGIRQAVPGSLDKKRPKNMPPFS